VSNPVHGNIKEEWGTDCRVFLGRVNLGPGPVGE